MANQNRTPLFDAMKEYRENRIIPFDVPGHKHGRGLTEFGQYFGTRILELDVNSMKCLDNISSPVGVIKEAEKLMAEAYSADHAFFLVNGTTAGVQAMILSACLPGEKIILPRNAHKSAINGLILSGAVPVYLQPEIDDRLGISLGVTLESVEKAIEENHDAKAILIINPTYYGIVSDIERIIDLAHDNGMAVLLDEAHGAHFNFNNELPLSGCSVGADMAAASIHKTGGSLTQSSVLLLNDGLIDCVRVKTNLNLMQTTSASYLLMGSLDLARKNLALNGERSLQKTIELAREARVAINKIPGLYAFGCDMVGRPGVFGFDETKLGIHFAEAGMSGLEAYHRLREEYGIQMELGDAYNALAILSIGDRPEDIDALVNALGKLVEGEKREKLPYAKKILHNPDVIVSPRNAFFSRMKRVRLSASPGEISGESIMSYPPGIPIVIPGERITSQMVEHIDFLKSQNGLITDASDPAVETIMVLGN